MSRTRANVIYVLALLGFTNLLIALVVWTGTDANWTPPAAVGALCSVAAYLAFRSAP